MEYESPITAEKEIIAKVKVLSTQTPTRPPHVTKI